MSDHDTICWTHDEMLSAECAPHGVPTLFVFDEQWLEDERVSLKRVVFMYECVLSMATQRGEPMEVHRGDPVGEVIAFAQRHGASRVVTHRSPLPRIKRQIEALRAADLKVRLTGPEPIVTLPENVDLKRFSRYWRKAEKQILRREE